MMPIGETVICYGTLNVAFVIVEVPHIYRIIFLHKEQVYAVIVIVVVMSLVIPHEPFAVCIVGACSICRLTSINGGRIASIV